MWTTQALDLVVKGHRLTPPPGCPRHIYSLMMSCWWVCTYTLSEEFHVVMCYACRHPEKSLRPSFHSLCQSLDGEPATLLQWREEDTQSHPQASLLGAELEAGKNLYTELQDMYLQNWGSSNLDMVVTFRTCMKLKYCIYEHTVLSLVLRLSLMCTIHEYIWP